MKSATLLRVAIAISTLCTVGASCVNSNSNYTPPVVTSTLPPGSATVSGQSTLAMPPVAQETSEWCWLSSGQMIFQHYNIPPIYPDYQCGIIASLAGPFSPCFYNCYACPVGAGTTANIKIMLELYPQIVQQFLQRPVTQIRATYVAGPLSPQQVKTQIDASNPILAGITLGGPAVPGQPQHAVDIVGYDATTPGRFLLVINDPFPYDAVVGFGNNPMLRIGAVEPALGRYIVEYGAFVTGAQWQLEFLIAPG